MLRYVKRNPDPVPFERPEGMAEALHRLLVERGIASAEEAERFLNPGEGDLIDPLRLSSMAEAVRHIRDAMDAGKTLCVYGDYDVDGVSASAILALWLRGQGADARVYLPSRHNEGYGLNEAAIREIAGWAGLMVTVDCGVTSVELVALAKSLGLDVIVTDHHRCIESDPGAPDAAPVLPDCPVVNPLLNGYPFPSLCGAGVAWKLVWALGGRDAAMEYVDIAALATVADVVPLTGENRVIVRLGLAEINRAPRPGVAALIASAGLTGRRITASNIAFQLSPRLNAGGRLGSAMRAHALLCAGDEAEAMPLAGELEEENTRRRQLENRVLNEAEAQLKDFDFASRRAIILAGRDWNPGIIGLAASRLVERYHYPVILLSDQGEKLTGSCRSIEGVDIHAALTGCREHIVRYGGHRQAAGLTLAPGALDAFRDAMDAWLTENVNPEVYIPVESYDTEADFSDLDTGLVSALDALQPTGFGNPAPMFRAACRVIEDRAVGADGAHLKLTLAQNGRRMGGIMFREGARAGQLPPEIDLLFEPSLNTFMGRTEVQLTVRAMAPTDPVLRLRDKIPEEMALQCRFLTSILYNTKIISSGEPLKAVEMADLSAMFAAQPQGTLVLAAGLGVAAALVRGLEAPASDVTIGRLPEDPRAFNTVCVWPDGGRIPKGYRRIVLAGVPGEYPILSDAARLRIRVPAPWTDTLPELEDMRAAYRGAMRLMHRPGHYASLSALAREVGEEAGLPETAAQGSLLAMRDMGLFDFEADSANVCLQRSARGKVDPQESPVWQALQRWRGGKL